MASITVTPPSASIFTQPLRAASFAPTGSGCAVVSRWRGGSTDQPSTSAPLAARVPRRNLRRVVAMGFSGGRVGAA
ncbi:hypothetical protein ACFJI0_19585 [Hydrogenophaga sp. UC242_53]|uniref:hypothetical protein n=1 Tax=Hydrogenophaga sp. UC242_53 TaxID=3350170 RepID=UPI0036D228FC